MNLNGKNLPQQQVHAYRFQNWIFIVKVMKAEDKQEKYLCLCKLVKTGKRNAAPVLTGINRKDGQ
ncbi:MAG: hypothetical protein V4725_14070 [Bacteroidota bacterium]